MKTSIILPLAVVLLSGCGSESSRVATLSAATPGGITSEDDSLVSTRRVWVPPTSTALAAVSRDGRTALTASGGALELRDIASGTVQKLTSSDNSWLNSVTFGRTDREVLYSLSVPRPTWDERELHIRNLDTGEDRLLRRFPGRHAWIQFGEVAPDGRQVVLGLRDGEWAWQLATVSIADGSVRTLKSLKWRSPGGIRLSPDGRFVAYDLPASEQTSKRDVFVMATDGSREMRITTTRESEHVVDWSSDGRLLLFTRDETGSRSLWRVAVSGGTRAGDEQLVRRDMNAMLPFGVGGDRLYYLVHSRTREFQLTPIDVDAGTTGPATGLFHVSDFAAWDISPNGASIAYFIGADDDGNGPVSLFVRNLSTGDVRELELPVDYFWALQWTDDPQIIRGLAQRRGRDDLYRIDLRTGATQLIPNGLAPCGGEPLRLLPLQSPDEATTFYLRSHSGATAPTELVACPKEGGTGRVLYQAATLGWSFQFTADKNAIVVMDQRRDTTIAVRVPVAGGSPVVLHHSAGADRITSLIGWNADGSALLAARNGPKGPQLIRVTTDGVGSPDTTVAEFPERTAGFRISHDHRSVFSVVRQGTPPELWVMEGLHRKNAGSTGTGR